MIFQLKRKKSQRNPRKRKRRNPKKARKLGRNLKKNKLSTIRFSFFFLPEPTIIYKKYE